MKLNRLLFPALLLIMAGIVMTGCSNPESPPFPPINLGTDWTAEAFDENGVSTKIIFTFNDAVTGLLTSQITFTDTQGTGRVEKDGSVEPKDSTNKIWELPIEVIQAGDVYVLIGKSGINPSPKKVTVHGGVGYGVSRELTLGSSYSTTDGGGTVWDISSNDITALQNTTEGSKLRLYFSASGKSDYGIGYIGVVDGDSISLTAPTYSGSEFSIDVWVSWVLDALGDGNTLSVATWTNHNVLLTKIELLEPEEPVTPPQRPSAPDKPAQIPMADFIFMQEIVTTGGGAAIIAEGKGNIEGDDFTAIKNAPDGSMLRFYMRNMTNPYSSRSGWADVGTVGGTTNATSVNISGAGDTGGADHRDFIWDVTVAAVLDKIGDTATFIFVNPYNACIVTMCELWKPDPTAAPGWNLEIPKDEHSSNYQVLLDNNHNKVGPLFIRQIYAGDVYSLKITFKSDADLAKLEFGLIDNSSSATPQWWAELSSRETIETITAGVEVTKTLTITANAAASGSSAAANKLIIAAGEIGKVVTLRVTKFELTKTRDGEPPEVGLPALPALPPGAFKLGDDDFTASNSDSQKGWQIAKGQQAGAEKLVLNLSAKPTGGMQLIWQPISSGWNQADGVLADNGSAVSGVSTWDAAKLTLTIDLTKLSTLDNSEHKFKYDDFIAFNTEDTKLFIGYYSSTVADLGIRRAYLTFADGGNGMVYELGDFDDGQAWLTNGVEGKVTSLTPAILAASKFLVLQVTSIAEKNGFGGLQLGFNGSWNSWDWKDAMVSSGWTQPKTSDNGWELNWNDPDDFYIVVDLSSISVWASFAGGDQCKFYLNTIPSEVIFKVAYLTDRDLTMPANGCASSGSGGSCWAVKDFSW
jgi:hypothetical protein